MKIYFYFILILLIISAPLKAQRIYESSARKIGIEQIDKFKSFLALPNNAAKTEQIDANINWAEQELGSLGFDLKRLKTSHLPLLLANKIIKKKIIEYSNTIIVFKSILPADILLRSYPKVSNTIAPKTCGTNIKKKDKKALIHPL